MSDVLLKVQKGLSSAIGSAAIDNGSFKVTTDTQKIYVDLDGVRLPLNDVVLGKNAAQIKVITAANALPKLYLASDTMDLYYYDATTYVPEGETDPVAKGWRVIGDTTYATKTELSTAVQSLQESIGQINSFDVVVLSDVISTAPQPGDSDFSTHTIYFAPDNSIVTDPDRNTYAEYIWVTTNATTTPITGHYEQIGSTEADLTNYYTKAEVEALDSHIWDAIGVTYAASTAQGYATIDDRLTALETSSADAEARADIDEINAKIGDWAASTDTANFVSIADRFTADEGDIDTAEANITEILAQLGDYAASTDTSNFVSVEDRFQANESDISDNADAITELNAQLGAWPASTDTANFISVAGKISELEGSIGNSDADIAELNAKLGTWPASTDTSNFISVAGRFTNDEADITELEAKFGSYADSTDTANFVDVETRFQNVEGDVSDNADAITELNAQLGTWPASTDTSNFISVDGRFTADEADISANADEIAEINAKLGTDMLASTDTGFHSVEERLSSIQSLAAQVASTSTAQPVLVSGGSDHDKVEYVSGVTVDSTTNSVAADAIVLGDATLTFDSVAGALVVNF